MCRKHCFRIFSVLICNGKPDPRTLISLQQDKANTSTRGATSKEASSLTFFEEIPRVLKGFKYTFAFCGLFMIGMILLASEAVPEMWRIDTFVAIFPLALTVGCHALLPIALNPNLIVFKW
jgi:hypothetical protein